MTTDSLKALAVGAAAATAGVVLLTVAFFADELGAGAATGFGWKQLAVGVAGVLALGQAVLVLAFGGRFPRASSRVVALTVHFVPFVLALVVYLSVFALMSPLRPVGDEPHYLLIAESLVRDGDVDLRNDYGSPERTLDATGEFPLEPHALTYGSSSELISFHSVGLPILLTPVAWVDGPSLARLAMVVFSAALAHQLLQLLAQVGVARPLYRWLAWAATVFSLPLVAFSNQIYPEVPAALLTVVGLRAVLAQNPRPVTYGAGALAAAFLPWLHYRYLVISVALAGALLYVAIRRTGSRPGPRVSRAVWPFGDPRAWPRETLVVLLPLVMSVGVMAVVHLDWYASPLPHAGARPFEHLGVGKGGASFWYRFLLGDLLSPGYGWIPHVPVHVLGVAGLGLLVWRFGARAVAAVAASLLYVLLLASVGQFGAGYTFPARYHVVLIPLVAVPLALVLDRVRPSRFLFALLGGVSLAIAVAGVSNPELLLPGPDRSAARIPIARNLQSLYPRAVSVADTFVVEPDDALRQVGRFDGQTVIASDEDGDPAGFIVYGSYNPLEKGTYRAHFAIETAGSSAEVARVEVLSGTRVLADEALTGREAGAQHESGVTLAFTAPERIIVEPRVLFMGTGTVAAGRIEVEPFGEGLPSQATFRDWPITLGWVLGTVMLGALFLRNGRRYERRSR